MTGVRYPPHMGRGGTPPPPVTMQTLKLEHVTLVTPLKRTETETQSCLALYIAAIAAV